MPVALAVNVTAVESQKAGTVTRQIQTISEKGDAVTNVWTGDVAISQASGHTEQIDKSMFTALKAGDKIRATFTSLKPGAQGKIMHRHSSWETVQAPVKKLPTECGDYFEYTITDKMVADIQTDIVGCVEYIGCRKFDGQRFVQACFSDRGVHREP